MMENDQTAPERSGFFIEWATVPEKFAFRTQIRGLPRGESVVDYYGFKR